MGAHQWMKSAAKVKRVGQLTRHWGHRRRMQAAILGKIWPLAPAQKQWMKCGGSVAILLLSLAFLGGCTRLHNKPADKYVYVTAKQAYLRDRVAAVSNRTGSVANGDKLVVLERARRFVKVRTPKGEIGWLDEKTVATQGVADAFDDIGKKYAKSPAVGVGTVRDEVYMHVAPGRDTERFYRLAEGDKLQLLSRATLAKISATSSAATRQGRPESVKTSSAPKAGVGVKTTMGTKTTVGATKTKPVSANAAGMDTPIPPPVMEDWWLVRDTQGHTGWLYSRMVDVDAPDTLVRYAEGQRIVGAYVLTHVNDPESGQLRDGHPDPDIPVYVTVLSAYKAGLPYDFDQVRVFSWNLKKHRYETSFRERNVAGYLPLVVHETTDPYGHAANSAIPLPGFTYKVLAADVPIPVPDPVTGVFTPGKTIEKTYRLEGNLTRRIVAPGVPVPLEAHPVPEAEKKNGKKKRR